MNCKHCGKAVEIVNGVTVNAITGNVHCGDGSYREHEPNTPHRPHPVQIVNRLEVIDHRTDSDDFGRRLVIFTDKPFHVTESRQDNGRTLKIFLD